MNVDDCAMLPGFYLAGNFWPLFIRKVKANPAILSITR